MRPFGIGCRLLLPLFFLSPLLSAQEAPNKFQVQVGSAMSGTEEFTISKTAKGLLLQGTSHLQRGALVFDLREAESFGDGGKFVSYKLEGTVGGQPQNLEAWVEGQQVVMQATISKETRRKAVEFRPNMFVSDSLIVSHYQVLLTYLGGENPPEQFWFIVPQNLAVVAAKVHRDGQDHGTYQGKAVELQKYIVQVGGMSAELWAEGEGRTLMRADVPMQEIQMIRDGFMLESKPPETAKPETFVERPISFPSGGGQMPGTLCLPAKHQGKVPIVVMVQGSGPHDRDEKIGGNYPFRDIAHDLAAAGIATLRYDKRTYAFPPPADPAKVTLDWEVTDDAVAALQFAATAPEANSVFLLGHNLGGTMAPYIAARYPMTRGIVLMAAASSPIDLTLAEQKRLRLQQQGESNQEIEEQVASQNQIFADVRAGKIPANRMINGAPASYWLDWMQRDPAGELKKLNLPVLVLQGGRDDQVYQADYDRFKQALKAKPAEFYWFPGLNHLFMPAQGKASFDYSKPSHVDPQVVTVIANWVKKIGA
jgi:dienelactone hydrolase